MVHEDPHKADTMITGLSDLLRRTLDLGGTPEIPLAGEIDLISRYLEIQKARFGDRLRVELVVEPAAHDAWRAAAPAPAAGRERHPPRPFRQRRRRTDWNHRTRGTGSLVLTVDDDGRGEAADHGPERVGLGTTRARLAALEARIDPNRFVRVHRSAIVQLSRVAEIRAQSHGDAVVVLDGGETVGVSRTWRERLEAAVYQRNLIRNN